MGEDVGLRYGATYNDPRIDPTPILEAPPPLRINGPIRAVTSFPDAPVFQGPLSVGADTGCANALLRVSGGVHSTARLGVGICPISTTPGIDVAGPVQPSTNNNYDLGTSSLRWRKLWGVDGDFSGGLVVSGTTAMVVATVSTSLTLTTGHDGLVMSGTSSGFLDGNNNSFGTELVYGENVSSAVGHLMALQATSKFTLGSGNYHEVRGIFGSGIVTGASAHIDELWGVEASVGLSAAGALANYGIALGASAFNASGTQNNLDTLYGVGIFADPGTPGLTSIAKHQYGVFVGDITGGTDNYAWWSGVGLIRFGDAVTMASTLRTTGTVGIGTAPVTTIGLVVNLTTTGSTFQNGVSITAVGDSGGTTALTGLVVTPQTTAAAYTVTIVRGLRVLDAVKGAGSTITTLIGLDVAAQTQGATNMGIRHADAVLLHTAVALTNGAGASTGTLTNAPAATNPTKWIPIDDNGTTRYIPAW